MNTCQKTSTVIPILEDSRWYEISRKKNVYETTQSWLESRVTAGEGQANPLVAL